MSYTLYITGAGVSAESGIPTFRGNDGYWTVGSAHYTPQEMATRQMYLSKPDEFLLWYFKRFARYRHIKPNSVHRWLSNKTLITQNIDGLDHKAGNRTFIPIHGSLDKMTLLQRQAQIPELQNAPWDIVEEEWNSNEDENLLKKILLNAFKISSITLKPETNTSLKPFVLLFDEYYTDLYRITEAEHKFNTANSFVFIGTSFNVNITSIALRTALSRGCSISIVDPKPIDLNIPGITYVKTTAQEYITSI
jgi:NAD-dependent deacetylase